MSRLTYTWLLRLSAPVLLAWLGWRARKAGGQWQVFGARRFGWYGKTTAWQDAQRVWVHAVSLGETRAAQPFVQTLLAQGYTVLLTHTTATGMAEGQRLHAQALAQGMLHQEWLPYDFPGSTQRFFAHYRPRIGVLIEREVWPNLLHAAKTARIPVLLASARLSARSAQRSAKAHSVMQDAWRSLDLACAQTEEDAQRLRQVGVRHVRVCGNFKFDLALPPERLAQGRAFAAALQVPIVAVASTREGEDALFVQALQQQCTQAALARRELAASARFLLIPRHPQRFEAAAALLREAGISFVRWSDVRDQPDVVQRCNQALVILGDTVGDMAHHYAAAQVAVVGGSFAPFGGQNLIEACAAGTPVIIGPHTWNFAQAAQDAVAHGAAVRVADMQAALAQALMWLVQPEGRTTIAAAASAWVQQHKGAVARVVAALDDVLATQGAAPEAPRQ